MKKYFHHISILLIVLCSAVQIYASIQEPENNLKPSKEIPQNILNPEGKPNKTTPAPPAPEPLVWYSKPESAFSRASIDFKPIMIDFMSPTCPWCLKLEKKINNSLEIKQLLSKMILLKIDTSKDFTTPRYFAITSIPVLVFCSSDGRELTRIVGFADNKTIINTIKQVLNGKITPSNNNLTSLMTSLRNQTMKPQDWQDLMLAIGSNPDSRDEIASLIRNYSPFPIKTFIEMLKARRIAIRLGALDFLEEISGDNFGFAPWDLPSSEKNKIALDKWYKWAGESDIKQIKFAPLTRERCKNLIIQYLQNTNKNSKRAFRILRRGEKTTLSVIDSFTKNHPDLSKNAKQRLKLLKYSILIPASIGKDPIILARILLYGKLDSKMHAIESLSKGGKNIIPILKDLLNANDPLIRETTIDSYISIEKDNSIPFIKEFLKNEKDNNVIFATLRKLVKLNSYKCVDIFNSFLNSTNEELAIIALNGIGKVKTNYEKKDIQKALKDKRWRVKIAALEVVSAAKIKSLAPDVKKLLKDKDSFVRYKAVETYSMLNPDDATKVLSQIYIEDDSLKGIIIASYSKIEKTIPQSFVDALKGKNKDVLTNALQGVLKSGAEALPVCRVLAESKYEDIRIPALNFLAKKGITPSPSVDNYIIQKTLQTEKEQDILAILHFFTLKRENFYKDDILNTIVFEDSITTEESDNNGEVNDLLDAFDDTPDKNIKQVNKDKNKKVNAKEKDNSSNDILDLFESFGDEEPTQTPPLKNASSKTPRKATQNQKLNKTSYASLKKTIKDLYNKTSNPEIKFFAAKILLFMKDKSILDYLKQSFPKQALETRMEFLDSIQSLPDSFLKNNTNLKFILFTLNDKNQSVVKIAAEILLSSENKVYIKKILDKLLEPNCKLKLYDIPSYRLSTVYDKTKKLSKTWAIKILSTKKYPSDFITFALLILEKNGDKSNFELINKYTKSKNKWIKRAAYHAIAINNNFSEEYKKLIPEILNDPSPEIRTILPQAFIEKNSRHSSYHWVHFFDEKHFFSVYSYSSFSYSSGLKQKLNPILKKALIQLTDDDDNKIRINAYLALTYARETIDIQKFLDAVNSVPDKQAVSSKIKDFLKDNYKSLGAPFADFIPIAMPSVEKWDSFDKVEDHFEQFKTKKDTASEDEAQIAIRTEKKKTAQSIYIAEKQSNKTKYAPENMRIVFFSKPGCQDCSRVKKYLKNLKNIFTKIKIETHDISKLKSMQLNESYCEKFQVPEKIRLVAPAVFSGAGFLIKNDITMDSLISLSANSASVPLNNWYTVSKKDVKASKKRITKRYEETSFWMILFAGLLDGINPCAFATIIFFLSYLQVAGRKPKDILLTGASFVSAVFFSYLAFGLGLNEIIARLYVFEIFRFYFNLTMGGIVFIIMIMSFYDGILCYKGKLDKITLQLPNFLKERIRKTIRTGSKHSNFIISAFIVGCIVSFLELACTGQVYAPMIAYMWQSGNDYTGSLFYLIIYNVAFIVPLMMIFIGTYFGLKNTTLINFMQKHTAMVKFATALLFLALFLILILHL